MFQSGHYSKDLPNYAMAESDYNLEPAKPTLDGESRYEDHPVDWKPAKGWFDEYDVRQAAYWALFAGALGHTYGCHPVWQFHAAGRKPWEVTAVRRYWHEAVNLPGAWDMQHLGNLMESRPVLTRIPDQSLIVDGQGQGADHVRATRGEDYLLVYVPAGNAITVRLGRISGTRVRAWWFDPRTGEPILIGEFPNTGTRQFVPPGKLRRGNDWVLVVDDGGRDFPPPGSAE